MKASDVVPAAALVEGLYYGQVFRRLSSDEASEANGTISIFTDCKIKGGVTNCTDGEHADCLGLVRTANFTELAFRDIQVGALIK